MTDDSSNSHFSCYIRGSLVPGYVDYCPLTPVEAYVQADGTLVGGYPEQIRFELDDVVFDPGFLVVHLGSIEFDHTVETAASALHYSLKSLFAACSVPVDFLRIRTTVELSEFMKKYRENYSHLILIGHGSPEGISFLDKPKPIAGAELAGCLGADSSSKELQIVSLCCHSGCSSLASALSRAENISEVLAPNAAFDMRWAVHFVTGFFLFMYIDGLKVDEAVTRAAQTSGNAPMCIWRKGTLVGNCKK